MNSGFRKFNLRDFERERTGRFNTNPLPNFNDKEAVERWRRSQEVAKHWQDIKNKWKHKRGVSGGSIPVPGKERMIQFEEEYRKRHLIPKRVSLQERLEEFRKRGGYKRRLNGGRARPNNQRGARRSLTPPTPIVSELRDILDDNDDDDDEDFYNDGDFRLGSDVPFFDEGGFWGELEVEDELENGNYSEEEKARLWNEYYTNLDTWEAIRMSRNDTGELTEFGRVINSALPQYDSIEDILPEYIDRNPGEAPIFKIYNAIEIRKYYGTDPNYYHTFESNIERILSVLRFNDRFPTHAIHDFDLSERLKIVCANEVHYQLMRNGVNERACKLIVREVNESSDPIQRELFDYHHLRFFIFTRTFRNQVALEGINQIISNIRQRFRAVVANDEDRQYILPYNIH